MILGWFLYFETALKTGSLTFSELLFSKITNPWLFCKTFLPYQQCQQKPRLTNYLSEEL